MAKPLAWGIASTLLITAIAILLAIGEACDANGTCTNRFSQFLAAPSNEIGDTLAGFAGALAFVWIIVTVWLQSSELSAQRQELVLTRREMAEQRVATQDMAKAMSVQAKIFEDEQKERQQSYAGEEAKRMAGYLRGAAVDLLQEKLTVTRNNSESFEITPLVLAQGLPSSGRHLANLDLLKAISAIVEALNYLKAAEENGDIVYQGRKLYEFLEHLGKLTSILATASPVSKIELSFERLVSLEQELIAAVHNS